MNFSKAVSQYMFRRLSRLTMATLVLLFAPGMVWAACSPYIGLAVINEVSKQQQNPQNQDSKDDAADFVEIKLLDSSIGSSVYESWTLKICENAGATPSCNTVPLSTTYTDAGGYPWLVISSLTEVGRYINLVIGTEVTLYDGNGDVVDYLSAGGFVVDEPACDFVYDTDVNTDSSTRRVQRSPDGTGDWNLVPAGNSQPPTDSSTNDDNIPADAPNLTINDVTVTAGQDLVFTLTLSAAYTEPVVVNYQSYDNTAVDEVDENGAAVADWDYLRVADSITIPVGATTATITVTSSPTGGGSFFLGISGANAVITDQTGKGVILPFPDAEWRFDEFGWTGSAGEVLDSSPNGGNGTAYNGASTSSVLPAVGGSPGTCYYGEFDGVDDYVEVPSDAALDFTSGLTITAWVRPDTDANRTKTILSKGAGSDFSYALQLTGSNTLEFSWCAARSGSSCTVETVTSASSLPLGQWSHVAITFSSFGKRLYINGNQDHFLLSGSGVVPNTDSLFIGAIGGSPVVTPLEGAIDELRFYDVEMDPWVIQSIMNSTRPCTPATLHHFHISFDGGSTASDSTAVTCEAALVTITAHSIAHMNITPGAGTGITLSTSTGQGYWSGATVGSLSNTGGGNGNYSFNGSSPSVTLAFNHTQPAIAPGAVNINVGGAASENVNEDPSIEFFESGFRVVDGADNPVVGNQIAAQTSATHYLQAIRTDAQTGACVGVFPAAQQVQVDLAAECNDPLACAGMQLSLSNNGTAHVLPTSADNGSNGASAWMPVSLMFGADSKAAFTLSYPDVGAISLHARHRIRNDDGTLSNDFMLGSSNAFVVSPATFAITTIDAGGVASPGTTGTGAGFTAAGSAFRMVVEARNALGNVTPNYGNEVVPESLRVDFTRLVFPGGGSLGVLNNTTSFARSAPGVLENATLNWTEVGTFTVTPGVGDGDYLGAGDVTGSESGNIGRFYPASFALDTDVSNSVGNSCALGAFTYMSENAIPVDLRVEAINAQNAVVLNYDSALGYPTAVHSLHAESNNDGNDLGGRLQIASATWVNGGLTVSDPAASFLRAASLDGPFTNVGVGIRLVDIDNANFADLDFNPATNSNCVAAGDCDSKLLAGVLELRFGRLYLQSVHGPESSPLPMVWQSEYWNGERFVLNADDHCSELPISAVEFVGASSVVNAGTDSIAVTLGGATSAFDFSDPLASRDCLSTTDIRFCEGRAGVAYGAPGSIVTYPIRVDLSGLPWLQGDWNQDGNYDDSNFPLVYVSFQHYRGHDRVIYWREVFD
ncbi:LamG domain-containing protein [Proteobacteria bacterium 005FR1]|nr:LamG domain-containing protein [Proteobacteria bacterium 005FR1]